MTMRPLWSRVVAVLALLWNLVGLFMFWQEMTLTPEAAAALPPAQQQIHAAMPTIAHVFFGIAVASGVVGSIGLVLAKRWSVPLLLVSFLGVAAQMATAFATTATGPPLGAPTTGPTTPTPCPSSTTAPACSCTASPANAPKTR